MNTSEDLMKLTRPVLLAIAKDLRLVGFSSDKKDTLVEKIMEKKNTKIIIDEDVVHDTTTKTNDDFVDSETIKEIVKVLGVSHLSIPQYKFGYDNEFNTPQFMIPLYDFNSTSGVNYVFKDFKLDEDVINQKNKKDKQVLAVNLVLYTGLVQYVEMCLFKIKEWKDNGSDPAVKPILYNELTKSEITINDLVLYYLNMPKTSSYKNYYTRNNVDTTELTKFKKENLVCNKKNELNILHFMKSSDKCKCS